ncbi:MAG: YkgJ family cysteine cluster protein [Termitinemataceae bacterium]
MAQEHFYTNKGLYFSCTQCSTCCRYESGYVFLSQKDVQRLASAVGMSYTEFISLYCRWVPCEGSKERLSLKEKSNYDCIFWNTGCTVYEARPLQCRTYPFWDSIVVSQEAWNTVKTECPGMDQGAWHSPEEIDEQLTLREQEPVIERRR